MKYLFSKLGRQALESLSFAQTLYAFDFDGTLAPIVSKPKLAKTTGENARQLKKLSHLVPVVVISGRSVADLSTRVRVHGQQLIGNHGLEGLGVNKEAIDQAESVCRHWLAQIRRHWDVGVLDAGAFVEDKGYSLALHYRNSRNKKKTKLKLFALIEELEPSPRVILGKSVMNLLPAGGPHKGVALLEAMMKLNKKCAFYIGDDDTDEDVFSLPDNHLITVRVGQKRSSQAQFYIRRQSEMNRLLKLLIELNQREEAHGD